MRAQAFLRSAKQVPRHAPGASRSRAPSPNSTSHEPSLRALAPRLCAACGCATLRWLQRSLASPSPAAVVAVAVGWAIRMI